MKSHKDQNAEETEGETGGSGQQILNKTLQMYIANLHVHVLVNKII